MAKKNTNKAYEPFTVCPPGVCPVCHQSTMIRLCTERSWAEIDEDGVDTLSASDVSVYNRFVCTNCGFGTDSYIDTDKGWRFSPSGDDDYIRKMNENKSYHSWRDKIRKNPFKKEK